MNATYESFSSIYQRAVQRHKSTTAIEESLPITKSYDELLVISDDRWLSALSQKIFQSGINWQVVRNKWPNFEEIFFKFDIEKMLLLSDEQWDEKAQNKGIIRHHTKVRSIRENALMMHEVSIKHGSFAKFIADWPSDNIVNLWLFLKKQGNRAGGNTGSYTLRAMGKDTFLLTRDVEGYLRNRGIITTGRDTKSALDAAQKAFNYWQQESARPFSEISQIIAMSVNR